jgi:hypothetical protein
VAALSEIRGFRLTLEASVLLWVDETFPAMSNAENILERIAVPAPTATTIANRRSRTDNSASAIRAMPAGLKTEWEV